MSTTPSPPPSTPRVDQIAWTLHPDNAFECSGTYHWPTSAPVPSGTLRLRPEQYQYYLAEEAKLVPQVLAGYDATTNPTPTPGPADVARTILDFWWGWAMPPSTTAPPSPQTGTAPDITT